MSGFLSDRYAHMAGYVPGEQPRDRRYIKLNTNESPYPPSPAVVAAAAREAAQCNLYSDPECADLREAASEVFGVPAECVIPGNGSDEILSFAFQAFCGGAKPLVAPEITYGLYKVLAQLHLVNYVEERMEEDLSIDPKKFMGLRGGIVIANPNAPTGMVLSPDAIEDIVRSNPDNIVIIDEAYADFGAESVIPLTRRYGNLVVTRTFSKSHSLAGARLGFGIAAPELIEDMRLIKYSSNPYSVNRMTLAMGVAALKDNGYYLANCAKVAATRDRTADRLRAAGMELTDSRANFLFTRSDRVPGERLFSELRNRGILVRHFSGARTDSYVRVTVGTDEQMDRFIDAITAILQEG